MKRNLHVLLLLASFLIFGKAGAQTYSAWGVTDNGFIYDTIADYDDTLYFNFSGLPIGAYGSARVVVYYEGDFGDDIEFADVYLPDMANIGQAGPYTSGMDCDAEDSTLLTFPGILIDDWGGTTVIKVIANNNVDPGNCSTQRVRVRFEYDYCAFGVPAEYADMTIAGDAVCPTGSPQILTGTPAGGTFSGPGVSGNTFNPMGLATGNYEITYTATDNIGCITSETEMIQILPTPGNINEMICYGEEPIIAPGGPSYAFSPFPNLTPAFDTAATYTFPAVYTTPTTYYYGIEDQENYYAIDTITTDNDHIVDVEAIAGDDRGGMAITDSYVYLVGDNATVRFDLDLQGPGVALPKRDGMFSDLRARKLYSLYNTDSQEMADNDNSSNFDVNAIIELDENLEPTEQIIPLTQTISMGTNNSNNGIFAGYGKVVLFSGNDEHAYAVDLDFGAVTDLGAISLDLYWQENWADWGVSGYDGTDYTIYYRHGNDANIVAYNTTSGNETVVTDFTDMSDMGSFVVHPVNQRMYFHYEGEGQFGGMNETLGYLDMTDSSSVLEGMGVGVGCPASITFTFNTISLGNDTTVCTDNGLFMLEAGLGYDSYTWNGVNNNWNVLPIQQSGQYVLEVIDDINCTVADTINVTVMATGCVTELNELTAAQIKAFPVPNKGAFNLAFGQQLSNVVITLVNAQGVVCHTMSLSGKQEAAAIIAENLATGVYFVQVTCAEGNVQPISVIIE